MRAVQLARSWVVHRGGLTCERHRKKGVDEVVLVGADQFVAGGIFWRPSVWSMVMLRTSQPEQAVLDVGGLKLRPSVWLSETLLRSSEGLLRLSRSLLESTKRAKSSVVVQVITGVNTVGEVAVCSCRKPC